MVKSFSHRAQEMKVPRTVVVKHPMGRPLGAAGDAQRHHAVIAAAFDLLETASTNNSIIEVSDTCRPKPRI